MQKKFVCKQCGLCCRNIHLIAALKDYHAGDGICFYLNQETNLCTIYSNRPNVCNIEKGYELFFSQYSEDEYLKMNYEGCELLWKKKRL